MSFMVFTESGMYYYKCARVLVDSGYLEHKRALTVSDRYLS